VTLPKVEGPHWVARADGFALPLLVPELPKEVPFGFLGRLMPTTGRIGLKMQIHRVPRPRSLDLLEGAGATAEAELADGRPSAGARTADLELEAESARELARRVAAGEEELFRVGFVLEARAPSRVRAEQARTELVGRLEALGFRTRRPVFEAEAADAPPDLTGTERRPPGYWHTLSTDGLGAFYPFIDEAVLEPGGILVGLLLDDAAPVLLDRWAHASYSWGIFGMTGAGKSFAAALLALRSRWARPEVELFLVDPLGEFGRLAEESGGQVVRPARPDGPRINPLESAGPVADRPEKVARVAAVFRALFPTLSDEETAALDASLARLYGPERPPPTIADLLSEIGRRGEPVGRLGGLLEVFRTGSLRHLDGPTTLDWSRGPIAFDLTGVADEQRRFYLAYLLDAIYGRLQASEGPKLVLVDEAHLLAQDPRTADLLDRLTRHVRHFSAGLLLASQNPDDFLRTESGRSLLRNLRATLLLRLPEVSEGTRSFFHLTPAEAEWLPRARLPKEAGYSEGLLRFGPAHLPIAVIASTPEYELLTGASVAGGGGREPGGPGGP
jgi:hypothetical protein